MVSYQGKSDYIALCYAQKDKAQAERYSALLWEKKLRVWSGERGGNVRKRADLERMAGCRAAVILVSENWLSDSACIDQLKAVTACERETVLVFLDSSDLTGNEQVGALLNRSVRMTDGQDPEAGVQELAQLQCITDCRMADGEKPKTKKSGLFGLFG